MSTTKTLKLLKELGVGAYGVVLRGVETTSGMNVAVKKSRVSLRVKRTLLDHEAKLVQSLSGHPAIPTIYAYGRFEHFEYLAMELGGESVKALAQQNEGGLQLKTVILLALQMIPLLQHIHSRGIVHRDVKPDHILLSLSDPSRILFIDYGIACPRSKETSPQRYNPEAERRRVIGTLKWASLNAHHGLHLSWRDDLESLAYVLIFLLRGNLPWISSPEGSTIMGAAVRVRMAKMKWSGSQLVHGHPPEFGQFLDQTRALAIDEAPPYERYVELFEDLYRRSGFSDTDKSFDWTPVSSEPSALPQENKLEKEPRRQRKLVPGQIVAAQLLHQASVLGITPDDELWGIVESETSASLRPAVVLKTWTDEDDGLERVTLAALARGKGLDSGPSVTFGPGHLETVPPWPLGETYCYVFPQPVSYVVGMVRDGAPGYRVREEDVSRLQRELAGVTAGKFKLNPPDRQALEHLAEHDDEGPLLIGIGPLQLPNEEGCVDWTGTRGWFDEITSIYSARAIDNGWPWVHPASASADPDSDDRAEFSDSYRGMGEWDNRQQERDETLTLRTLPPSLPLGEQEPIPCIGEIIDEYESDESEESDESDGSCTDV
ncbi:kinase-like protein [Paxillus ammoniavirescens]|nr:kinase-like protein [Paxillus ammoniavirescens]